MKSIIIALAFLGATVSAADGDTCPLQCTTTSGNWSGNSSVIIELEGGIDIAYDVETRLLIIVNTKLNLAIAVNGNFILILNLNTGGLLLIDVRTYRAIYIKIDVTWKNQDGSINFTLLVTSLQAVIIKYGSITTSTSGSFDFQLILTALYSGRFDLLVIFRENRQLALELQASFEILWRLAIQSGGVTATRGIWGFFLVIIGSSSQLNVAIVEVIRASVQYYGRIELQLIVFLVERIRIGSREVVEYSTALIAYLTISGKVSIQELIVWIRSGSKVSTLTLTLGEIRYTLVVIRVKDQYVLTLSYTIRSIEYTVRFVLVDGVLIVVNVRTSFAVILYRNYLIAVNASGNVALVATNSFFGLRAKFVEAVKLSADLRASEYKKVAVDVKKLIASFNQNGLLVWGQLRRIILQGSITEIAKLVGLQRAAQVKFGFSLYISQSGQGDFGVLFSGVFSYKDSFTTQLSRIISFSASASVQWQVVVEVIIKIFRNERIKLPGF